ncbi:MAG: hypothetical protein GQ542_14075 [Desulforhopalus sp.]|nr:hypothetical protein [Desulforhopalus sp.]
MIKFSANLHSANPGKRFFKPFQVRHRRIQPNSLIVWQVSPIPGCCGIIEYKVAKEQVVDDFTVNYLIRLLKETGGNVSQAAEISGLTRTALQKIMRRRNITAAEYRSKTE